MIQGNHCWISGPSSSVAACFVFATTLDFLVRNPRVCKPIKLIVHHFSSSSASTSVAAVQACPSDTAPKWEEFRKKKVVMRVGYVGSNEVCKFRGMNTNYLPLKGELEQANFKAGGIRESNYGGSAQN